jgi:hypothetical protein
MPLQEKTVIRPAPPFSTLTMLLSQLDEYVTGKRSAVHDNVKANYRIFGVVRSIRGDAPEAEFCYMTEHELMPAPWSGTVYAAKEIKSSEAYKEAIQRYSAPKMKTIDVWEDRPRKWEGMIAIRERGIRFVPQLHFNVTDSQDLMLKACFNVIDGSIEQDIAKMVEDALHIVLYEEFPKPKPKESYKIAMKKDGRLY